MPETQQHGSIFRDLLLPGDQNVGRLGTFRLRYAFAEDGCRESQVILAKLLLSNISNTFEEKSFNAQLAVFWLLQAAKKGHNEAFELLKDCSQFEIGTRLISKADIEYCLNFSQEERIARQVTYSLFRVIMSDTDDVIPEDILRENVELIFKQNKRKLSPTPQEDESSLWNRPPAKKNDSPPLKTTNENPGKLPTPLSPSPKKSEDSDDSDKTSSAPSILKKPVFQSMSEEASLQSQGHVSFKDVMSSVQSCLEGNPPLISLTPVTQSGVYQRWFSMKYFRLLWDIIMRSTEKLIFNFSSLVLLTSVFFLCLLLQLVNYSFTLGNEMSTFISKVSLQAVTFLSFTAMISYACFVLHINYGGDNFIKWLSLIKIFEPNVRSADVERKYVTKTTVPFTIFFFVSVIYITLVPLSMNPLSFADIGILSFVLMVLVDRTIYKQRYYVNISLALNALTCIYKTNIFKNMYSSSLSYFNITMDYEVMQNLYIHLSFLSCLALPFVLPYIYVKMSLGQKRGWHLVLLPHLMSLMWMNLACIHLIDVTNSQFLLSSFTWILVLLASRYISIPLTLVLYIILNIPNAFQIEILVLTIVFIILYFTSVFFVKKFKVSPYSKFWSMVFSVSLLILSYQVLKTGESSQDIFDNVMPWDKYQSLCHQHSWFRSNSAERQISCLLLKGKKISLEGSVTSIEVVGVRNNMEFVANMLPQPLQNWFVCGFGKDFASCDSDGMTNFEKERCEMYHSLNLNRCHLQNWDEYKYKLVLELNIRYSLEVEIYADHGSSGFVRSLKEGDSLKVIGALESNIGKSLPGFILKHAKCTACYSDVMYTSSSLPVLDYKLSFKNIVQLYLAPLIVYDQKK